MFSLVDKELQEQEKDFAALLAESTYTLLYFYPKDNTPGCTVEANDFTALVKYFLDQHVQIIGVSKDSCASHEKFIRKQWLGISLISDPELILHKKFGARWPKKMYGKLFSGVIRSTFLLDSQGNIVKERKNVRAKGHAARVLQYVQENN